MSNNVASAGVDGYIDVFGNMLKIYRKERGNVVHPSGSHVPQTTYGDVRQTTLWWHKEYLSHLRRRRHSHPTDALWQAAIARITNDMQGADPKALYPDNKWFWFTPIKKLARHLEEERATPTRLELIIESIDEAVDDRIDDVASVLDSAGDAAGAVASTVEDAVDAVVETGEKVWSGVKIAAIVGVSLIGAAIVLPPIVRAFRD